MEHTITHSAPHAAQKKLPETIRDEDVLARRMVRIGEEEIECTLFRSGNEFRIRTGRHEYVILGTTGTYGIPIPLPGTIAQAEDAVTIEAEEGMTLLRAKVPNIAEGHLLLHDEDIARFIEDLTDRNDEKNPVITISRGSMHIGGMYDVDYSNARGVLRVRKVTEEE